ncbi:hypothetical protein, partial [uncultured Ruthenibacterium sp.]|uniref:hypothetical protein n=1 Tax=uncultured Ruthenibacterium sp. TaxID=1905347 RepID=UPI00349EDED0
MKYKLHAFFSNRNGIDELGRTLLWGALAIMILGTLLGITFLYNAALILLLYVYIRAFSRNLEKCRRQNAKYIAWRNFLKLRFRQRKTHKFYRCRKCKQKLRVPKGKGKICITCPNCGE